MEMGGGGGGEFRIVKITWEMERSNQSCAIHHQMKSEANFHACK